MLNMHVIYLICMIKIEFTSLNLYIQPAKNINFFVVTCKFYKRIWCSYTKSNMPPRKSAKDITS